MPVIDVAFNPCLPVLHNFRHAQYSLSDYKAAAEAFRRGLELDPSNTALKTGLSNAEARIPSEKEDEAADTISSPDSGSGTPRGNSVGSGNSSFEDMMRGMQDGSMGGMPDMSSLMNNPMMMQMAQQMMSNGGLERLMSNPTVANMVGSFHLVFVAKY